MPENNRPRNEDTVEQNGPKPDQLARRRDQSGTGITRAPSAPSDPDVILQVPKLKVEQITLEVDDLHARVALHAAVGNLVQLDVGADVGVGRVKLEIKGVEAEADLRVRLEKVYAILERTLDTLDRNPQVLEAILRPLGDTIGAVGRTVDKTVPELGKSLGRTVEGAVPSLTGSLGKSVEETVPALGKSVGNTVEQTAPALGQSVGKTVEQTGQQVGGAVGQVGSAAGKTVEQTVPQVGDVAGQVGGAAGKTVEQTGQQVGGAAGKTVEQTGQQVGGAAGQVGGAAGKAVEQTGAQAGSTAGKAVEGTTSGASDEGGATTPDVARTRESILHAIVQMLDAEKLKSMPLDELEALSRLAESSSKGR